MLKPAWRLALMLIVLLATTPAFGQVPSFSSFTYEVFHPFSVSDGNGYYPSATLIQANDGKFYGTSEWGGEFNHGTVFQLAPGGDLTTFHSFSGVGTDGADPGGAGLLQASNGYLYGTTRGGGANGYGTVFRFLPNDPLSTFATLHSFTGTDGRQPEGALIQAIDGYLYGTTFWGGASDSGTVFRFLPGDQIAVTTLHSFSKTDGCQPHAALIQASDRYLYGTALNCGAYNRGTVFRFLPGDAITLSTLHDISVQDFGGSDTTYPYPDGALIEVSVGGVQYLYGTTSGGGPDNAGAVFRLPLGATPTPVTPIYVFNGTDGRGLLSGLIQGSDGNFYGTTRYLDISVSPFLMPGTVFQLTKDGALTSVHKFSGNDGAYPFAALIQASDGNFYGTTTEGGPGGGGVVFVLRPQVLLTVTAPTHGTVIATGFNCGTGGSDCTKTYNFTTPAAQVTLTATADLGSVFGGWTGCATVSGAACTVTMDAPKTVTATFTAIPPQSLAIEKTGAGTVTSTPAGISCGPTCSTTFLYGQQVSLHAEPTAGFTFTAWGGACAGVSGPDCSVEIVAGTSVSASFTATAFNLTITTTGNGTGTVTASPVGTPCGTSCASYPAGTPVILHPHAGTGSTFAGWDDATCQAAGTGDCTLSMTQARTVTARFVLEPTAPPPTDAIPVITSLSPNRGPLGRTVTITGEHFTPSRTGNTVTFAGPNNTRVVASVAATPPPSASQLTVTVPAGAALTGQPGVVRVANIDGLASQADPSAANQFTVTTPLLASAAPAQALAQADVPLTLGGANFAANATVTIHDAANQLFTGFTAQVVDATTITLTANFTGRTGAFSVIVTNPDPTTGDAVSSPRTFAVVAPPSLTVSVWDLGGQDLTINGLPTAESVTVTLSSTNLTTAKCSSTSPKVISPTHLRLRAATATPLSNVHHVTVTLTHPTTAPWATQKGTATNEDCPSGPPRDFSLSDASQLDSLDVPGTGSPWETDLYSFDFGGTVTITVTAKTSSGQSLTPSVTGSLTWPVDSDGDGMPDAFEAAWGLNPLVSAGDPATAKLAPDGLTNVQKYRGIFKTAAVSGTTLTFAKADHVRLDPTKRHLFVRGRGFRDDPLILANAGTCGVSITSTYVTATATAMPMTARDNLPDGTPFCPRFEVGTAFQDLAGQDARGGVEVHDVSAAFPVTGNGATQTALGTFPQTSLDPSTAAGKALLALATVAYDTTRCVDASEDPTPGVREAADCDFTQRWGTRDWRPRTLGNSNNINVWYWQARLYKRAIDGYFSSRPYQHRENGAAGTQFYALDSGGPGGIRAPDGRVMLAPLRQNGSPLVGDQNDTGDPADSGEAKGTRGPYADSLLGDTYMPSFWSQLGSDLVQSSLPDMLLSVTDSTNDGCIELPLFGDPTDHHWDPVTNADLGIPLSKACASGNPRALYPQATKQQVVRHVLTHELGHVTGQRSEPNDESDIMNSVTIDWIRDDHFGTDSAAVISIRNGGTE